MLSALVVAPRHRMITAGIQRVVDALKAFQQEFPTVALRLHVEALGAVVQLVLDRTAVLGVSGPLVTGTDDLERIEVGMVELIPVEQEEYLNVATFLPVRRWLTSFHS